MEELSRLVSESLAQNGVKTALNCLRLEWSRWFRCESSFSVLLAPSKPGIFALGEEMISPSDGSKRMLALFEIAQTGDLGITLGSLFLPGAPLREKLETAKCFARYTVIEDAAERASAYTALRHWMEDAAEVASGMDSRGAEPDLSNRPQEEIPAEPARDEAERQIEPSAPFAMEAEVHAHRNLERLGGPFALPSGF
jgi:hypothetical protein